MTIRVIHPPEGTALWAAYDDERPDVGRCYGDTCDEAIQRLKTARRRAPRAPDVILREIADSAPKRRNKWACEARVPWRLIEEAREALKK